MPDFNGLEVSQEVFDAINSHTDGLKTNSAKLLDEKKAAQQLLSDANRSSIEKDEQLQKAAEDKLIAANDIEGLKKLQAQQLLDNEAKSKVQIDALNSAMKQRDTVESKQIILDQVTPNMKNFASALLNESMTISYNEKGETVKEFKTDNGVVGTEKEFLSWASENSKDWQQVLVVANSSGAGTQQSSSGGISKKYSEMSLEEKAIHNSK